MKLNKKISAFTLSEMIVVLILTVIVIGIAFSVLNLVQKQMSAIQVNFEKNAEINRLETALYLDFNRYNHVVFSSKDNTLQLKSALDSITYKFENNTTIRAKDTFDIAIKQKWVFFNGKSVNDNQIDAIKIETTKDTQNQHIFVFKQNSASQFMMAK